MTHMPLQMSAKGFEGDLDGSEMVTGDREREREGHSDREQALEENVQNKIQKRIQGKKKNNRSV